MIEEKLLSGKYRLCRKLGQGRSGTVYLAFHTELEEYRAVKIVPKSMSDYSSFRKEALLLKSLRHPGIPLVYDLEEDAENSFLVEELVSGETLYAMIKRIGRLSARETAVFGIQICTLIDFLHSAEDPILYLDLQPKNLLISDGQIRLIDFDHAQYAAEAETGGERYGTAGFAAPELYEGGALDERTDVYAIGALLYFMYCGKAPDRAVSCRETKAAGTDAAYSFGEPTDLPGIGETAAFRGREADDGLLRVIRGCMEERREERYPGAIEVKEALEEFRDKYFKEQAIHSQTILFVGARAGLGTTHAALGMSDFLARHGRSIRYQEECDTDTVRTLARNKGLRADRTGVYHIGGLALRPYYGRAVCMPYQYYQTIIKDAGVFRKQDAEKPEADLFAVVCGAKWWETDQTLAAARYFQAIGRTVLLFNHVSDEFALKLPEDVRGLPCLRLPFFPNPFRASRQSELCYGKLFALLEEEKRWEEKGKRRWFPGRKAGS